MFKYLNVVTLILIGLDIAQKYELKILIYENAHQLSLLVVATNSDTIPF